MTLKAVLIIAGLLLLAGMVGRSLGLRSAGRPKPPPIEAARKCPSCGAYVVGEAACARADCPGA